MSNPYESPIPVKNPGPSGAKADVFQVNYTLYEVRGWIRLLGILNIIGGVLYCLTICGIIIGWLPIWIGINFNAATSHLETAFQNGNAAQLKVAVDKLGLNFKIFGVLAMIAILLSVAQIAVMMMAFFGGLALNM